nr:prolyl-tRNA synthetase associated domain-containing protein 1 [Ipomoea batatas]
MKVPLGSVTPFALVNESARHVSLVLDRGLKTQERCIFHPLSNDTSIALNARDLDKFLNSIGKTLAYVDLEANPPIGKDQPPDLAALVPSDAIVLPDLPEKASLLQGHEHSGQKLHNDIPTNNKSIIPAVKSVKPSVDSQKKSTNVLGLANSFADPNKFVEEVLEKTSAIILSEIKVENAKQDGEQLGTALVADLRKRLSEELKSMATMFKNVAYTEGFAAGTCNQPKRL